jgi:hypothetical protein
MNKYPINVYKIDYMVFFDTEHFHLTATIAGITQNHALEVLIGGYKDKACRVDLGSIELLYTIRTGAQIMAGA